AGNARDELGLPIVAEQDERVRLARIILAAPFSGDQGMRILISVRFSGHWIMFQNLKYRCQRGLF
ncbi:MAG: hypothetical protein JXA71_15135, partial [Chitinispirillaceae bacterium]|nr:hypothetical protein [Chitinispirillaceae bacterium]